MWALNQSVNHKHFKIWSSLVLHHQLTQLKLMKHHKQAAKYLEKK